MDPAVGASAPETQLNSVVLPDPFGPDQPEDLALLHLEGDLLQRGEPAEPLGDPGDGEHAEEWRRGGGDRPGAARFRRSRESG